MVLYRFTYTEASVDLKGSNGPHLALDFPLSTLWKTDFRGVPILSTKILRTKRGIYSATILI